MQADTLHLSIFVTCKRYKNIRTWKNKIQRILRVNIRDINNTAQVFNMTANFMKASVEYTYLRRSLIHIIFLVRWYT